MNNTKEVDYYEYCKKCQYKDMKGSDDPCNTCLTFPFNIDSHKPVYFKEKENVNEDK